MAIIKCKMCGGDMELSPDKTFGTCEYCGSVMTLPKIDDEQRAAQFNRGNHFRRQGEFDKALAVYERIVAEDDTDAEAHWCCALCRFGIEYVEDPATYEYIPTCHRASFDSFLEDVDYLAALEYSDGITRRQYQKDGAKIAEVQRAILATSQKEEPFDVFICYKETDDETKERTRDSLDAQEIYYNLTQEGYRVFFARITLEDKAGSEYEPYIFAALNSAKVMVVVGEKAEYFSAVWVKNEWSRFLSLMRKDRTKLLLPCYKNVDPYDLPEQLGVLQSFDMAKIGFMQDLIRGIRKVLQKDEPKETVKETVVVQQSPGGANITAQLKRGMQALEDRDWAAADGFFDKALDMDAECAEAFFGKALAALKVSTGEALVQKRLSIGADLKKKRMLTACERDDKRINEAIAANTVPGYLDAKELRKLMQYDDRAYSSETDAWEARIADEPVFWESDRNLSRALRFAKGEFAAKLHSLREAVDTCLQKKLEASRVMDRKSEEETAKRYHDQVSALITRVVEQRVSAESKREKDYQVLCEQQEKASTEQEYSRAAEDFEKPAIRDYKDSAQRAKQCREEAEKRKAIAAKAAAAKKKKSKTIGLVVTAVIAVAIALALIITQVIIPSGKYKSAEALLAAGDYDDAAAAFAALGKYKNSTDMINESNYQKAQAQLAEKYYDGAYSAFTRLGKYKDSADMAKEAWYQKAEAALAEGDFDGARRMFTTLQDYKDSADMANEAWYQKAEAALAEGDFDGANQIFTTLQGYKDSADMAKNSVDMANEAMYQKAASSLAEGDFNGAYQIFTTLQGYKDSADMALETIYQRAETTLAMGNEAFAAVLFTRIGDYRDAQLRAEELWDRVPARQNYHNSIATGGKHTVAIKTDGTVVAVGRNKEGQCGVSEWSNIVSVAAGAYHTVGLRIDGTVIAVGKNINDQCSVSDWSNIISIASGYHHTVGLRSDGTVVATGENNVGQCDVTAWTDIVAIAANGDFTLGLKSDGTVVSAGESFNGQRDVADWTDIAAIIAGNNFTIGIKKDGAVVITGLSNNQKREASEWKNIIAFASSNHMVGLRSDGTVVASGANSFGQCDVSDWTDIVAIAVGGDITVGLKSDGTVVAVGYNGAGQCDVSLWTDIRMPE